MIGDDNFRIEVAADGIHVYNRHGHHDRDRSLQLFPHLGVESDGSHAFYLGARPPRRRSPAARQALCAGRAARLGRGRRPPDEDLMRATRRRARRCAARKEASRTAMPMIRETIVTTPGGRPARPHRAARPHRRAATTSSSRPSALAHARQSARNAHAVASHIDDVRVFAGCLTGRRDWPTGAAEGPVPRLAARPRPWRARGRARRRG